MGLSPEVRASLKRRLAELESSIDDLPLSITSPARPERLSFCNEEEAAGSH
jgi:hypothetical protein